MKILLGFIIFVNSILMVKAKEGPRFYSFLKDLTVIDVGYGVGSYNQKIGEYESAYDSRIITLKYEYALRKWAGWGFHAQKIDINQVLNNSNKKEGGYAFMIKGGVHFSRKSIVDLHSGISFGYAPMKFEAPFYNDGICEIKGSGFAFNANSTFRIYILKKVVGVYGRINYAFYQTNVISAVNSESISLEEPDLGWAPFNFSGFEMSAGIVVRIY